MDIDRLAPTKRPAGKSIGRQRWRDLLFLHWPVPVEALRPLVPAALAIDTFDGVAYVGLIPFLLEGLRPAGVPEALALTFLETNARTYVHFLGKDPGVFFFSLDAASRLAVIAARATFGLPYFTARMHLIRRGTQIEHSTVRGKDGPFLRVLYEPRAALGPAEAGTLDHFLLERYFLHVARFGRIVSARIHHSPYPRQAAHLEAFDETILAAAGVPRRAGLPPIVHYSTGVDVELFAPQAQR